MKRVLTFLVLFLSGFELFGALSVQVQTFPDLSNVLINQYPYYTTWIKVYKDGLPVKVQAADLIIIENNKASKPVRVADTSDGWSAITWLKKMRTSDSLEMDFKVIAIIGNETATSVNLISHQKPSLYVTNQNNSIIEEVGFYNVPPDQEIPEQVRIFFSNDVEDGFEKKLTVDSVKTHTPYFRVEWLGSDGDGASLPPRLPYAMMGGFRYWINIFFKPIDKSYYEDSLTIYYDNGATLNVPIFANVKLMPAGGTILNMVYPNGGEKFSPCGEYEIKWRGHSPVIPVKLEYSSDGGANWSFVANVQDSVFKWRAPNAPTANGKFRVSQPYYESYTYALRDGTSPIPITTFNSTGSRALAGNDQGRVNEWNLSVPLGQAPTKVIDYLVEGNSEYPGMTPLGLDFLPGDSSFVGLFSDNNVWEFNRIDTLVWFKVGQETPIKKKELNLGFLNSKMIIDSKREILAVVPKNDTRVALLSATDGSLIKYLDMGAPIINATFNSFKGQLAVSLWDGQIKIFSVPDFSLIKAFTFRQNSISKEIAISPNGEALLVSGFSIEQGVYHLVCVIDLNTMQVIRNYRPSATMPQKLMFSPNSRSVIVASEYPQQLAIYNVNDFSAPGYMNGHSSALIDCKISPDGHSLISTSEGVDNLLYRTFSYAESDASDGSFSILAPVLETSVKVIESAYLGTTTTHQLVAFCNRGELPFVLESAWMEKNEHFKLKSWGGMDTIAPGACKEVVVEFTPSDTGLLEDNVVFDYCGAQYSVKIEGYSKPRNIVFSENPIEFGELCVGDTTEREITFITNSDPAPLFLNFVNLSLPSQSEYSFALVPHDTLLPPGGSVTVRLRFHPTKVGPIDGEAIVFHSSQTKITASVKLHGVGIGSFAEMSHEKLLFVPEEPIRKFKIKNVGSTPLTLESAPAVPAGSFTVLTSLPATIAPGGELELEIKWLGGAQQPAALQLNATPCLYKSELPLAFYSGKSTLSAPNVVVRSVDEAVIPINYVNAEPSAYLGERSYVGAIELDEKLFMPNSIESSLGSAEILSNTVTAGRRKIEFKVTSDFPLQGELCKLRGVPGIYQNLETPITFVASERNWSANVVNTFTSGSLKVIPVREDLTFNSSSQALLINGVSPNPATDVITVEYSSTTDADVVAELYDALGKLALSSSKFRAQKSAGAVTLNVGGLETGIYSLILRSGSYSAKARISIVK